MKIVSFFSPIYSISKRSLSCQFLDMVDLSIGKVSIIANEDFFSLQFSLHEDSKRTEINISTALIVMFLLKINRNTFS